MDRVYMLSAQGANWIELEPLLNTSKTEIMHAAVWFYTILYITKAYGTFIKRSILENKFQKPQYILV